MRSSRIHARLLTIARRPGTLLVLCGALLAGASALAFDWTGPATPPHQMGSHHMPRPETPAPNADRSLPGMPPVPSPRNVYAAAGPNMISPSVRSDVPLVYVPHTESGDVWTIDPGTFRVVARYPAGREVQHVVPSWDMRSLYATDDLQDHVLEFDPRTGKPGKQIPVVDPYNLYFTPNGRSAISVAEARKELVWYEPHTWQQQDITELPDCAGVDHAEFSADGKIAVFSCEFAGRVAVVDVATHKLLRTIDMPHRHSHMGPQDIKLAPDGSAYYVADCDANGLWVLDGAATHVVRFIPTGRGAHGLYMDRDAKRLFVSNRLEGSISVFDAISGAPQATWRLPNGGSPDMGGLSADGQQLWLSGRYNHEVYVLSTFDGRLLARIPVGSGPHGLCVWPQPGRYSLGHTGITR